MGEFPVTQFNNGSSYPYDIETRSFGGPGQQGGGLFNDSMYPGLGGNPYGELVPRPNFPVAPSSNFPAAPGGAGGAGGLLGNFNFAQLKSIVDKMGGIDGIIGTMSKVQKIVGQFQQVAPMLKVIMGSFGKKAATKADANLPPVRRRRRKKRVGSTRKGARPVAGVRPVTVRRTRR